MKSRLLGAICYGAVSLFCATPQAATIWDYSPETTGALLSSWSWNNESCCQNFAEQVNFSDPVRLTGMDIYGDTGYGAFGTPVIVRIWTDDAGQPGTLIHEFGEALSIIDRDGAASGPTNRRKHADFTTSIELAANTDYWIGMSGDSSASGFNDIKQSGLVTGAPDDSSMAEFSGTTFQGMTKDLYGDYLGDMAFRLEGVVVPLPAAAWLFGSALLALIGISRRAKAG